LLDDVSDLVAPAAQQDPFAGRLGGDRAPDAPGEGRQDDRAEGAQGQPPFGIGDLEELVELLGGGQAFEGDFTEDHGWVSFGEGTLVKSSGRSAPEPPSTARRVPVSKRRRARACASASRAPTSVWRAAVSRSRWLIRSIRVEVPARSFFSSLTTARSNRRTASDAFSTWRALLRTASRAEGTSAPTVRERRSMSSS